MLKLKQGDYEVHQNLITYEVSIIYKGKYIKDFNPRAWISESDAQGYIQEIENDRRK